MTKQRADGRMSGVVNGCSGDIKKHESYRFSLKTLPKKKRREEKRLRSIPTVYYATSLCMLLL